MLGFFGSGIFYTDLCSLVLTAAAGHSLITQIGVIKNRVSIKNTTADRGFNPVIQRENNNMALLRVLRPTLPILIGASLMLSLSMGLRQSLGIFLQPITHDIGISVSDFSLAIAVQNLAWGFLQPFAGAFTV